MELSKIGPPLKSSTATTSGRRRAESLRMARGDADAACDGLSVAVPEPDSWLMELKPPSNRRVVTSVLHVPPARPPMIKSTASDGALVTPLAPDGKSTRQRGVKHSITKRFTRGARREVR